MLEPLYITPCTDPASWVESSLAFTAETSPSLPGPVSLAAQPWAREPLSAALDPAVEHLHLVMGTQTGKTTLCMFIAALLQEFEPMPLIWALPTAELVRRHAKKRMFPFWRSNPILSASILDPKQAYKTTALSTGPMDIYFVGAREPASLAHTAAAYVIADEEAKYDHIRKDEAHPSLLLQERVKSFVRHLIVHASTPNTAENYFWQSFTLSDQRHYYLPCPVCGHMQHLVTEQVKWSKDGEVTAETVRESAWYECKECRAHWDDSDLAAAMARGEWRPDNPTAPAWRRGYHLNSLYSPFVTIGEFAETFFRCVKATDAAAGQFQNFVNSWQALPFTHYAVKIRASHLEKHLGPHRRGDIPPDAYYVAVTYDPGQAQTHWVATAIGRRGSMTVIDYGTISAIQSGPGAIGLSAHFMSLRFGRLPVLGIADSGDWTQLVYDECAQCMGEMTPSKGGAAGTPYGRTPLKAYPALDLLSYNDHTLKSELYAEIIARGNLAELRLPADSSEAFLAGLSGQTLITLPSGARKWKELPDDHYGDCLKLARLSWWEARHTFEPI